MKNHRFPRWSAPLLGIVVGGLCGLRAGLRAQIPLAWFVVGGGVIGGLAGAFILLLEPTGQETKDENLPAFLQPAVSQNRSGVVGRFLAVAGCLLCWFPILGLVLNLVGFLVNRSADDWARFASLLGLAIAACLSTLFVVLLAMGVIS